MKRNYKFKFATLLSMFALTITTMSTLPNSLLLWGEPTPTLDQLEK